MKLFLLLWMLGCADGASAPSYNRYNLFKEAVEKAKNGQVAEVPQGLLAKDEFILEKIQEAHGDLEETFPISSADIIRKYRSSTLLVSFLFYSCAKADNDLFKVCMEEGVSVQDTGTVTGGPLTLKDSLFAIAFSGFGSRAKQMAKELIEKGASFGYEGYYGEDSTIQNAFYAWLMLVAKENTASFNKLEMIEFALENGAEVEDGMSPLILLAEGSDLSSSRTEELVGMLVDAGANIYDKVSFSLERDEQEVYTADDMTALHVAALCGRERVGRALLKQAKEDGNLTDYLNMTDSLNNTALQIATIRNEQGFLNMLNEFDID